MPLPAISALTQRFISSRQLLPGDWANAVTDSLTSSQNVVATPAGTQATSIAINAANVNITAVATANDGVLLPVAKAGLEISIINSDAADAAKIFARGSDGFRTGAVTVTGATGVALAALTTAVYRCVKDGVWSVFTSA